MNPTPPTVSTTGANWLSVAEASAALGVSARAVQKRAARGTLKARKVEHGGAAVWEIDGRELGANMDAPTNPNGCEHANLSSEMDANPVPFHAQNGREPVRKMDADREADFREEIRFLRGLVEQRDRDAAELRAALRKALEAMPKALTSGAAENGRHESARIAPESPQMAAMGNHGREASNGPQIAPERGETGLSYADIADWLEAQVPP